MRLAIVCPYALSAFGGVQEQALAMSRELSHRGHEVLLVAPDRDDRIRHDTPATVVRLGRRLSLPANGSRAPLTLSPRAAREAREAIDRFDPQIVHLHEPFAPLIGWGVLRAHRRPSVGTFHRSGSGPALSLTRPLLTRLAGGLDAAAAVSEAAARTIHEAAGITPTVLFNGFETERFVESPRTRGPGRTLVTVGRLEERKGTGDAIAAVRAHNARGGEPWRLVIVGDGPERTRLESLAAGDPLVEFAGAVSDAEKRTWLRRADALVAPATRGESFGLVLLEGMASETLVVASDISGYREATGGHATLADPGDPRALEAAIAAALAGESTEAIAAARTYADHWSMRELIDRYLELYETARGRFGSTR